MVQKHKIDVLLIKIFLTVINKNIKGVIFCLKTNSIFQVLKVSLKDHSLNVFNHDY